MWCMACNDAKPWFIILTFVWRWYHVRCTYTSWRLGLYVPKPSNLCQGILTKLAYGCHIDDSMFSMRLAMYVFSHHVQHSNIATNRTPCSSRLSMAYPFERIYFSHASHPFTMARPTRLALLLPESIRWFMTQCCDLLPSLETPLEVQTHSVGRIGVLA